MRRPIALFVLGAAIIVSLYMLGLMALGQQVTADTRAHFADYHAVDHQARVDRSEQILGHQGRLFASWATALPPVGESISPDAMPQFDNIVFRSLINQLRAVAISRPEEIPQFAYYVGQEPAPELEETLRSLLAQVPPVEAWSLQYWTLQPFYAEGEYWIGIVAPATDPQTESQSLVTGVFRFQSVIEALDEAIAGAISSLWAIDMNGNILYQPPMDISADDLREIEQVVGDAGFAEMMVGSSSNWGTYDSVADFYVWDSLDLGNWAVYIVEVVTSTDGRSDTFALWEPMLVLGVVISVLLIGVGIWMYLYTQRMLTRELEMRTRQLVQVRTRYSTLFEHSPDLIFLVDPFGEEGVWRLDECNQQAARLLGYDPSEMVGMDVNTMFVNPIDWDDLGWYLGEHRSQQNVAFDSVLRRKDGSLLPLELSSVILNDQGQRILLVIGRDVRSRQQVQTLEDDYDQMVLALNQVAIDITSTLTVDTILVRLVEAAHRLFPQSFAATVQMLNETGNGLITAFASEGAIETPKKVVFKPGVGVAGLAVAKKKVVNIDDVHHDPRFVPGAVSPPFKSLLVAPMVTSSRVWGTLSIEGKEAGAFSKRDERMANMLARQAGVALENAYLYRAAQQDREIADTLREIGLVLTGTLRQEDVLRQVIEQIERVLHYSAASIYLTEPEGSYYRFVGVGYEKYELKSSGSQLVWLADQNPVMRRVDSTGEVVIISDVTTDPSWLADSDYQWVGSWAGAPIQVRGEVIGVFCLDHEQPGYYDDQDKRVLEALATQVSIAIENALLFEQVQNHALNLQEQVAERTEEIRAQQARNDAILRSIDDAVITFNATGVIMFANEASCRLVGYDMDVLIGSNAGSYFHRTNSRNQLQAMLSAIRSQELWRGEIYIKHRDDYPILLDAVAVPYLQQDGTTLGYIASMRPLSDEQATERMKAQFMTLISHELRTPLTNLKLHLHLLRKTSDNPASSKRYMDALEEQTDRLTGMMEKVLTVIRLTDSEAIAYDEVLSLKSLLDSLMVRFRSLANEKNIKLSVEIAQRLEVDGIVRGDGQWVTQACYELLENALVYTPENGTIAVKVHELQMASQRFMGISIYDTGPGIAPQELEMLQTAFMRVGEQRSGETPGSGLGLFIASTVGEQLGGGLLVDSELGQGSVFTLYLPLKTHNE